MFFSSRDTLFDASVLKKKTALFSKPLISVNAASEQNGILIENIQPPCVKDLEDSLFEAYRDIAECAFGISVTVTAEYDAVFAERIRAILRSAVYGEFSLMLRGILCEKDIKSALSDISRIFCELEVDGREFNGYIQRGICIDSPILLRQSLCSDGIDVCVIDAERLINLMTNNTPREDPCIFPLIADEIKKAVRQWSKTKCLAILGRHSANTNFCKRLMDCGIYSFFISRGLRDTAINAISAATRG